MRSIELFSGAGGLAKGLEISGFEHVAYVENNRDACITLRNNFNAKKVFEGDIREYEFDTLSNIDVIAGGPPCQPFSLGGKHKSSSDERDMFPLAIKAVRSLRPKAFIFENVKGLLRPSFSDYFKYILLRLQYPDFNCENSNDWSKNFSLLREFSSNSSTTPEYRVQFQLMNAADYGVSQTRERVIIVGVRSDLNSRWLYPEGKYTQDRLLWDQYVSGEYWEKHKIKKVPEYSHSKHFLRKIETIKKKYGFIPPRSLPWKTLRDVLSNVPNPKAMHQIGDHLFRAGARSYPGHTGSMFDQPSKTIKAGDHGVPGGENMIRFSDDSIRYLTVYEAKLVQSFPASFKIHGAWGEAMRQIGNAVPVTIAEVLGAELKRVLSDNSSQQTNQKYLMRCA